MAKITNFTEFFRDEKDVYVQNIANAQVSVGFQISPNHTEGFLFSNSRDPVNLTQHIPFSAIKNSMDFRKMLSRRPPVLQILSMDEYDAYFKKRASSLGLMNSEGAPDTEAAMDLAEERRRRTTDKNYKTSDTTPTPLHRVAEKGSGPGGATMFGERERVEHDDAVAEDEIINPRVLHLCNQVKAEVPEEERMPARELLESLSDIPTLSLDDIEHIRAHGYYKSVKKWAKQKASELIESEEEADDTEE